MELRVLYLFPFTDLETDRPRLHGRRRFEGQLFLCRVVKPGEKDPQLFPAMVDWGKPPPFPLKALPWDEAAERFKQWRFRAGLSRLRRRRITGAELEASTLPRLQFPAGALPPAGRELTPEAGMMLPVSDSGGATWFATGDRLWRGTGERADSVIREAQAWLAEYEASLVEYERQFPSEPCGAVLFMRPLAGWRKHGRKKKRR